MGVITKNFPGESSASIFDIFAFLHAEWFGRKHVACRWRLLGHLLEHVLKGTTPPESVTIIIPERKFNDVYTDLKNEIRHFTQSRGLKSETFAIVRADVEIGISATSVVRVLQQAVSDYSITIEHRDT